MGLLDDDLFEQEDDIIYDNCIKYMLDSSNYETPYYHALSYEVRYFDLKGTTINTIIPHTNPDKFLIGFDYLRTHDINKLTVRLFDINLIKLTHDGIFYEDDNGTYKYKLDKNNINCYFGRFKLCTHSIFYNKNEKCYGNLVISLNELANRKLSENNFLVLPISDMEHYLAYNNRFDIKIVKRITPANV